MQSDKKLLAIYEGAKSDNENLKQYYTFEDFKRNAKEYIKDLKNPRKNTVCGMTVSRSGMTRHFNFDKYNMLLNIIYNQKFSWLAVKVGGCGMDMHWHLKFRACEELCTKNECEKWHLNNNCSSGKVFSI